MAKNSTYRVAFRRRREGKTDYRSRLKLLVSQKPRIVIRNSNKLIRMQLISYDKQGDHTAITSLSSDLIHYGYKGSFGNTPAAFLTGLIFGKKALEVGYHEALLDIGHHTPVHGSILFAALKGAVSAGLSIPHDPAVFPSEERLRGDHIAQLHEDPSLVDHITAVKEKIMTEKKIDVEAS
jgi:large subunit ribosomal protein L18